MIFAFYHDDQDQSREPGGRSYAQLGDSVGMTEAALKSAVQRMRQHHRELLREEIAYDPDMPPAKAAVGAKCDHERSDAHS